jgi:hypothetical protein
MTKRTPKGTVSTIYATQTKAEPDPGPGWLRSRFMGAAWLRHGVAPCGRASCPVCQPNDGALEDVPPARGLDDEPA